MPIPVAKTPRIPTLACMGFVSEVGQVKETQDKGDGSPNYYMIPVTLSPYEAGRKKVVNFMFRPEWFDQGFDPNTDIKDLWGEEKSKGPMFVYRRSFGTNSTIGSLTGLAGGDPKNGDALYDTILESLKGVSPENIGETVEEVLRTNLVAEDGEGQVVGYIVGQRSRRVQNQDTGKWDTVYEDQTDVTGFWQVTEKAKAEMEKRSRKQKDGLFRVTWEVEE